MGGGGGVVETRLIEPGLRLLPVRIMASTVRDCLVQKPEVKRSVTQEKPKVWLSNSACRSLCAPTKVGTRYGHQMLRSHILLHLSDRRTRRASFSCIDFTWR